MKLIIGGIATLAVVGVGVFALGTNSGDGSISTTGETAESSVPVASSKTMEPAQKVSVKKVKKAKKGSGLPKLHPVKEACIEYKLSGQMMSGSTTRCHRKYAYEQYAIDNMTVGVAGFTQTQLKISITIGNTIYVIDPERNTGTKTPNPIYNSLVENMTDSKPEELLQAFLASMDMTPTGEIKNIANYECKVYSSQMMGNACFTNKALMLEQDFMGNRQTAVSVTMTGGDDAIYNLYKTVTLTDGPDLSEGLGGLMDQIGQ